MQPPSLVNFVGVLEQVDEDLVQGAFVGGHDDVLGAHVHGDGEVLGLGLLAHQLEQRAGSRHEPRCGCLVSVRAAGLDARHVEDVVDHRQEIFAARADVAAIFLILVGAERAEDAALHHLGKADDGVERRAQLVAHIGEEFGLGAVGALGLRLLVEIALGEVGELLRLRFELLARLLEVENGRDELLLGLDEALLVALERGDVRADRDVAAVLGAALVDLQPAAILQAAPRRCARPTSCCSRRRN